MTQPSRFTVTIPGLERTIVAAVQQSSTDCRGFLGVYIEPCSTDEAGANWRIKGIKYGSAIRGLCDASLDEIVKNLKERYVVGPSRSNTQNSRAGEPAPKAGMSLLSAARARLSQGS